ATGGTPVVAVKRDEGRGRVVHPWFLPDGERFIYMHRHADGRSDLMFAEPGKSPRPVMPLDSAAQYAEPGLLYFARDGALLAQGFDCRAGRVTGGPRSVAQRVRYFLVTGNAVFAASASGAIAFQAREDEERLIWFDRAGRELGPVGPPGSYATAAISGDG